MLTSLALAATLAAPRPLLLVHLMAWFEASPTELGWHWRMNRTAAQVRQSGKVASHYTPTGGPYDSKDPRVVDRQMKLIARAGFDGILVDWYGPRAALDYGAIHERTQVVMEAATKAGLKIGVVYEDQSAKHAIEQGSPDPLGAFAKEAGAFLAKSWLKKPNWVRLGGRPAVLVFGPQAFGAPEWQTFRKATGSIALLTLHAQRAEADGVFDWPIPSQGVAFTNDFLKRTPQAGLRVAVAYPRFHDFYAEGGAKSYGQISDRDGATYRETLEAALKSGAQAIQVATWNDWQEGTQIEPSQEFGLRDLIATQAIRRRLDPSFPWTAKDLRAVAP